MTTTVTATVVTMPAKVTAAKGAGAPVSAVATALAAAVSPASQGLSTTSKIVTDHSGFADTLMLGSFWAEALLQALIAAGTVGFAYWLFTKGRLDEKAAKKEEAQRNVSKFLDLVFIVRAEIEDEKLATQRGKTATPVGFLNRDMLDDMMMVWTLLSDETQTVLMDAHSHIRTVRGYCPYSSPRHMEAALDTMDEKLGLCATELQKDLARLGKQVVI